LLAIAQQAATPLSVSTGGAIAYGIAIWLFVLLPGIVTLLKGHRGLFAAGLAVAGIVWAVACFRLARPESRWAQWFYGPGKMARARARYGDIRSTTSEDHGG